MTAGAELARDDGVRKVEIEEKCVAGLDTSDLNEVGDSATVDGKVGGNGKDDTDDSSYVFVNGGIEVSVADKGDVNFDSIHPKSDPADEVDQFQKVELGIENGGMPVYPLVLKSNGIFHESATVVDPDVKDVKDEVNLENRSTVDPLVLTETNDIAQDVNGHVVKITGEEGQVVKSTDEEDDANEITNVEAKVDDDITNVEAKVDDDIVSGITLNPIESSQVTLFDSESAQESESQVTITQSVSNGITNVEAKTDDISSGIAFDQESTMTPIESSQVPVPYQIHHKHFKPICETLRQTPQQHFLLPFSWFCSSCWHYSTQVRFSNPKPTSISSTNLVLLWVYADFLSQLKKISDLV